MMEYTFEVIRDRIKNHLENPVNKIEGSFSMDNISAVSQELAMLIAMEVIPIPDNVMLDTAEGLFLDRKAIDFNEARNDGESDDSFRKRILEKIQKPISSGNKNHYIYWAKQVAGISHAKVIPCWAGAGTVKVIILSDKYGIPDDVLIQSVADNIEANRPIGADVTVSKAIPFPVSINITVTLTNGYNVRDIKQKATELMEEYLKLIAFDETKQLSYYKIGDIIFGIDGVSDIISYTLNGGHVSLQTGFEEFFKLQEVLVNGS